LSDQTRAPCLETASGESTTDGAITMGPESQGPATNRKANRTKVVVIAAEHQGDTSKLILGWNEDYR